MDIELHVWGIGPVYERLLSEQGVTSARGLRDVPTAWARRHMTVRGARTVLELTGTRCLPLEAPRHKSFRPQLLCSAAHMRGNGLPESIKGLPAFRRSGS